MKLRSTLLLFLASFIVSAVGFAVLEPAITYSQVTDNVTVNQSVTAGISISSPADITMTALTITQNTAVGSAAWTVVTNVAAGYELTVHASSAPAMSPAGIIDYTPAVAETPETWSVSNAVEFGFSARGTDVSTGTYGTDSDCIAGANVPSTALKWRDFDLTGSKDLIATRASATPVAGISTEMCVATEQNGVFAAPNSYSATITGTATSL